MKNIFIFFCLILAIGLNAQKITPTVIANAGNVVKNATHSIEWTLGEFMTETLKNNNGSITQGFHQANLLFVAVDDAEIAGLEVFPNPFTGQVTIRYTVPPDCPGDVALYLRDFTGRQIKTLERRANAAPGDYQAVFDGSGLPTGIYLYELVVCNGTQVVKKAEKISH